jgi:hypothetical protein
MKSRRVQNAAAAEAAAALLNVAREVLLAIGEDMTPATRGRMIWAGVRGEPLTCTIRLSMPRQVEFSLAGEPLAVFAFDEDLVQ